MASTVPASGELLFPVCNAARGLLGPLEEQTAKAVASVLDVNLAGTVRVLQAFLPDMKRRRSGRILVTGSMGGLMGESPLVGSGKRMGGVHGAAAGCLGYAASRLFSCCPFSLKAYPSMKFTVPASSRWKVYARAWRFSCCPGRSSESLPIHQNPLIPDLGGTLVLKSLPGILPGLSPPSVDLPSSLPVGVCSVRTQVLSLSCPPRMMQGSRVFALHEAIPGWDGPGFYSSIPYAPPPTKSLPGGTPEHH